MIRGTLPMILSALCLVAACTGTPKDTSDPDPTGTNPDTDPTVGDADSDGDGLLDSEEIDLGLDPNSADTDADGISDADEVNGPTDPLNPDSDGDRLLDGAEAAAGTDPLLEDSDGDGYLDGDEVTEGADPTDPASVIYAGGWPYNPYKDAMNNPGFAGAVTIGGQFPDLTGIDQHGDLVHLYDFAGQGKPIVLDFSAMWCGPCHALADYLGGANNGAASIPNLRDAVEAGEVYWFTVVLQDITGGNATGATSSDWAAQHPEGQIPVVAPQNPAAPMSYIDLYYFPSTVWLDENMLVVEFENSPNPYAAIEALEADLASQ